MVKPLTDADNSYAFSPEEQKLIREAEDLRAEILQKGMVLKNYSLQNHIDSIGKKMVPEGIPPVVSFRFYVLKDPHINAFALPQGTIFLHAGLLARMKSESQLAFVMAHEITHVIERHLLEFYYKNTRTIVAAKVTDLILAPVGFAGGIINLTALASINGYGREKETEADEKAMGLMAKAGYSTERGITFFDAMNEVKEMGGLEAYFYASHPANVERRDHLRTYISLKKELAVKNALDDSSAYLAIMKPIILLNIELRIQSREYLYAMYEIDEAVKRGISEAVVNFYRGEALRLMAENPKDAADEEAFRQRKTATSDAILKYKKQADSNLIKAEAAYWRALARDSTLCRAHRGLGLVAYDKKDTVTAINELTAYLNSGSDVIDRRHINTLLKELGYEKK